jgi:hypothetical protein
MGKRIVIAGGSGFLGINLARHLTDRGDSVVILSRSNPKPGAWSHAPWDGRTDGEWMSAFDGADAVVNLAGRSVDCVKHAHHVDQIWRSRIESTLALGRAVDRATSKPGVWVQMSTAHIYGDSELPCDESSVLGYGLAPDVGRAWEDAFDRACPDGVRRAVLRTSFVLGRDGGALPILTRLAKLGLGGTIGTGTQGMSWIHERDMNRIFARAIDDEGFPGMCIASAPSPMSNREFMRTLRRTVRRPFGLPSPGWLIRLGSPVIGTDPELALYGRYVTSSVLDACGFGFEHESLESALNDLLR